MFQPCCSAVDKTSWNTCRILVLPAFKACSTFHFIFPKGGFFCVILKCMLLLDVCVCTPSSRSWPFKVFSGWAPGPGSGFLLVFKRLLQFWTSWSQNLKIWPLCSIKMLMIGVVSWESLAGWMTKVVWVFHYAPTRQAANSWWGYTSCRWTMHFRNGN